MSCYVTPTAEKGGVCCPYSGTKSAFWDNVEETSDEADVDVHVEKLEDKMVEGSYQPADLSLTVPPDPVKLLLVLVMS